MPIRNAARLLDALKDDRDISIEGERIRLLRLAFDASLSSFAGRQRLYEQFYTGDPMRTQALFYRSYDTDAHIARIHAMLDELEAR